MTILNKMNTDYMKEPLFLGNGLGLQRYDRFKHPVFFDLFKKQLEFFWRPEEIELKKDRSDFKDPDIMSENEKFIFTSNLLYQTMMDSVICRGVPSLLQYVSNPELEACLKVWEFFEQIHSYSYTYIIKNVYPNPSEVLDSCLTNDEILKRASVAVREYDRLNSMKNGSEHDLKRQIYLTLVSINILEAVRFYVSFVCAFAFAENKKMIGNADIVKLIKRDESCVTPDTEVLTHRGWVRFDALQSDDMVAQYHDDCRISFVTPNKIIKNPFNGYLVDVSDFTSDFQMLLTPDHRVVLLSDDGIEVTPAEKTDYTSRYILPNSGYADNGMNNNLSKIDRLNIALHCRGYVVSGSTGSDTVCTWNVPNKEKVIALQNLLVSMSIPLTVDHDIITAYIPEHFNIDGSLFWVNLSTCDYAYCRNIIAELQYWQDAEYKDNKLTLKGGDILQAICCLAGYYTDLDKDAEVVTIRFNKGGRDVNSFHTSLSFYCGDVYCLSVPTGMFVARRRNHVFVTGNCHLYNTQEIIKILQTNKDEGFTEVAKECEEEAHSMFLSAANEEKEWASYLFHNGSIIGLNENVMHQYINWLVNARLKTLNLPYETGHKNPIAGWSDAWMNSESVQVAPQEHEVTTYLIGASTNDLSDMNFDGIL